MKHIILVEDDAPIRDAFQIAFRNSGYLFTELTDGEHILNNEIEAPDLFLLDRQVSGVDGLDVCRYIKNSEHYKRVPVIMLSANPDIGKLAMEAGADGSLSKPFSLKELHQVINSVFQ